MKKFRFAVLTLLLFLSAFAVLLGSQDKVEAASSPRVIFERRIDSRTIDLYVQSPSTDSWVKEVRLLLPAGWTKNTTKTWPTLWLLHGGGDDYTSWTKGTDIEELSARHDMMVVIPNTSWCSAYSDWWNYGRYGSPAWETYLTTELRSMLHTKYRANPNNAAVAGLSMGGLGALKLAMHHPDMFKAVASFSGNADPLHAYNNTADGPDLPGLGCASDWKRVWGDYRIPEQRAIWERNNPYVQAAKFAQQKFVFVSSGDGIANPLNSGNVPDPVERQVNIQSRELVKKLESLNISVASDFYSGTHTWPYWQVELHKAWPGLLEAINVQ